MAVFYLKHPVHGSKVAISEFEVEHDKQHGWEVYDPDSKPAKKAAIVEPVTPVAERVFNVEVPEGTTETEKVFTERAAAPVTPVEPVVTAPEWLSGPVPTAPEAPKNKGGRPKKSTQ